MQIFDGIEAVDLALYLKSPKVLIVSDFHIGFEESLNKQGVFVPRFQLQDVLQRLEMIFKKIRPKTTVINGDLKHEFGRISEQEWRDVIQLIDFIGKYSEEIVVIRGNHDKILGPIADKRNVKVVDRFLAGNVLVVHGDKLEDIGNDVKTVIIGHEHPAVSLREKGRVEKFKCFLAGKYKKCNLVVLPSFNPIMEGTDVLKEQLLSPYLADISSFEVFVADDKNREVLKFGKVSGLIKKD